MDSQNEPYTQTIRIRDKRGKIESKEVTYDEDRISLCDYRKLEKMGNFARFIVIDPDSLTMGKRKEGAEEKEVKAKSVDTAGITDVKRDINIELTLIIWGLRNTDESKIIGKDFLKLIEIVEEKDPMDLKKKEEEILEQKKMKDGNQDTSAEENTTQ